MRWWPQPRLSAALRRSSQPQHDLLAPRDVVRHVAPHRGSSLGKARARSRRANPHPAPPMAATSSSIEVSPRIARLTGSQPVRAWPHQPQKSLDEIGHVSRRTGSAGRSHNTVSGCRPAPAPRSWHTPAPPSFLVHAAARRCCKIRADADAPRRTGARSLWPRSAAHACLVVSRRRGDGIHVWPQ